MSKKILLVRATPNDLDIGGYNLQQFGLGKAFCKLGYDYDFITFKRRAPRREEVFFEANGCRAKIIELPRFRFMRWGINKDICKEDFINKYDLIICQEYYQMQTYLMSKHSDKVVMYSGPYYDLFMLPFESPLFDFFFTKKINKNIKHKFVKSVLAEEFLAKKGYTGLRNIGVALDTERFDVVKEIKPETQKIVDFMKANRCILYVGTLCDRKNYPFLLDTYQKILKKAPDVKFVMIGKSKQTAFAKLMGKKDESYAEQYNKNLPEDVKKGIYHIDRIENPQLKFIYPLAKAFLLPSKLEIFGMVLLEAMYLGTPVITSRNGGSMTLIKGRQTGQMLDGFDADEWADAVMKYIDNPEYTQTVKDNAQKLIRDEYNWEVLAKKFLSAIEE